MLLLLLTLAVAIAAQDPPATTVAALRQGNAVFLHWNDFHGQFRPQLALWKARGGGDRRPIPHVGGAAALAGHVRRVRAEAATTGQRVIVTDAGDWYQGTIEGNASKGLLAVQFLSRLQPDAVAIGNHEYDFGPDNVRALVAAAKFPVLGANVLIENSQQRQLCDYVRPFHVVAVHGVKIALIGVVTADTKAVSTGPWGDATFEDELAAVRATLPAAKAAADVVVLLTHCGLETDRELAKAFPEIPLILGGHSHTGLKQPYVEGSTWIVQTHGKASEIYRVDAHVHADQKRLELLRGDLIELDPRTHPDDPDTAAWIAQQTRDLTARWDRVIATLETPLDDDRSSRSTAAGNLVCDVFVQAAKAQLAFSNKGGIRTRLQPGPLTPRMLYELLPFENNLVSMDLTGAQIRAVLQAALGKERRPLEIGGGRYHYEVVDGERKLTAVWVGDVLIADDKTYRVATSSFLARGGDGLSAFADGKNVQDHEVLLRDVLIGKAERDGKLVADGTNRIMFDDAGK
ncbi:MAG: bifunctional metallophosphatase/5'-nucleotidase [Planctomycetes bacterium]|nr:bifunctional metallophosphatase/5'-nucleotidase [Planctomycetota bacterium]